jgi:hypothetical protein
MLPVNFVGSLKSVYQAISGGKFAFARTPKIKDRTTAPFLYVVFPYVLIGGQRGPRTKICRTPHTPMGYSQASTLCWRHTVSCPL